MDRAPGQRFRFEQYLPYLRQNGFECELSFLLDADDDRILYSKGNYLKKAALLLRHYQKRIKDLRNVDDYDFIFICREALMTRSTYFEKAFSKSKAKVIYDFDDAIWMNDTSHANRLFRWMKNPAKISKSIGYADLVFAGNEYLAEYARRFNQNVVIMPTTIDTDEYTRRQRKNKSDEVVIGWSGSLTTIKHFEYALPFLNDIKNKYGNLVRFKVIGDGNYRHEELQIEGQPWIRETEIDELSEFDIGIMPLPDDPWAKGKCGLKGLQYMALEIPAIMSPVGVNTQIISDGTNGFLASSRKEWFEKLSLLIESEELRHKMGSEARHTVETRFSVHELKSQYLRWFNSLVN